MVKKYEIYTKCTFYNFYVGVLVSYSCLTYKSVSQNEIELEFTPRVKSSGKNVYFADLCVVKCFRS